MQRRHQLLGWRFSRSVHSDDAPLTLRTIPHLCNVPQPDWQFAKTISGLRTHMSLRRLIRLTAKHMDIHESGQFTGRRISSTY